MSKRTCSIDGCGNAYRCKGYCNIHYRMAMRYGTPTPAHRNQTEADRFWAKVDKSGTCWIWTGNTNADGYGKFWHDGESGYAHRWSYEKHYRPLRAGETVDHLCRQTSCVNPDHLDAVSVMENSRRALFGTAVRGQKTTTCLRGHPKEPWNVYIHGNHYHCKECRRTEARERHRRNRDEYNRRRRERYAAAKSIREAAVTAEVTGP